MKERVWMLIVVISAFIGYYFGYSQGLENSNHDNTDNSQLEISRQAITSEKQTGSVDSSGTTIKIKLNSATSKEFQQLPGLGPKLSERIITDRSKNGPFKSVNEITRVKGIGNKLLKRIRPYIYMSRDTDTIVDSNNRSNSN